MSIRIFTQEQITNLQRNTYVQSCSSKSLTFTKDFKEHVIHAYTQEFLSPQTIFKEAGFDLSVIGRETPKECIQRWKKIVKEKGVEELQEQRGKNARGRNPKPKTDTERIQYLEAKVEYLQKENDFLATLRARKTE